MFGLIASDIAACAIGDNVAALTMQVDHETRSRERLSQPMIISSRRVVFFVVFFFASKPIF
jgi:hypothetical protein